MSEITIDYLANHPQVLPELAKWYHEEWGGMSEINTLEDRIKYVHKTTNYQEVPTTIIALEDNQLMGGASLVVHDMETHKHLSPWLANVFVAPAHRNGGLGSRLVQRIIGEARELRVERLYLFTPDRENFYARLGWRTRERVPYRGKDVAVMEFDL